MAGAEAMLHSHLLKRYLGAPEPFETVKMIEMTMCKEHFFLANGVLESS